ncbi:putative zinc-binding metallopeptidase [Flagellimonas pacifica]|uniref:Putative zinc-binding metallo-peptidase n=1 Tax=Flagellimonas pacifica TaxID=1247520 RepID=A0A285ME33_9FLAO|nr:putative zinc-binding metallopeptidase [Allomuricauda parva]SNY95435.1 Putative zinc-binding metallo-peptidase [Allomuricauda parva]
MKRLQQLKWVLLLFFAILTIQSCQKDDVLIDQNPVTDTSGTDDTNNSDGDNTDNGSDTNGDNTDGNNDENPGDNSGNEEGEGEGEITLYTVEGSNIVKKTDYKVSGSDLEFQKDTNKHNEVWELVKKIVPASYLSKMSEFMIFSGENSGTAGYVFPTSNDLSKWQMGIAIDFAYQGGFNAGGELAYTIIHEFGHILTLDIDQVDASISQSNCNNYFTGEGCAKTDSYINKLQTRYWADIWSEYETAQDSEEKLEQFYQKHRDRYVTAYASTNPGEDIAEVFATFVTRKGGPNGNSIAEQKIQLMYNHPELITFRDFIRGNMSSSKGRSYLPIAGSWKKAKIIGNPKKGCTHRKKGN